MATYTSNSLEETQALGETWGKESPDSWVIGLEGDLGAGKTVIAKGVARGLGIDGRIQSPTFALVNEYQEGRLPFYHLDLYRLDTPEQVLAAGLEPYLIEPKGITVVEWVERWAGAIDDSTSNHSIQHISIESVSETVRRIRHEDFGN